MIKMIKGTYGLEKDGDVIAMNKDSKPFSINAEREQELIDLGVAVKVEIQDEFTNMKMQELRDVAKKQGINVKGIKSREEIVEKIREEK
jgi:hypothetical protein